MFVLQSLPLSGNLVLFAISALGVWFAGTRLTYLVDALSDRLNLAKSLMGLLVLSLATSLPEVATTLSAAVQQARDLVLNNLFGGIALQTAILAMADGWARGAITNYPSKANHALEATLLVMLLAFVLVIMALDEPVALGWVGFGSLGVGVAYAGTIFLLRRYDAASDWVPVDIPDPSPEAVPTVFRPTDRALTTPMLVLQSVIASLVILGCGLMLVHSAEAIAVQTGLGPSFIGVTLLAGATSLPELSTSITAVRMGAYTMAISNIFGSNLIMLVLVLPADVLFFEGPILRDASVTATLAIGFGILVTSIYLTGLIVRRKPRVGTFGTDSVLVICVFFLSTLAYYIAR